MTTAVDTAVIEGEREEEPGSETRLRLVDTSGDIKDEVAVLETKIVPMQALSVKFEQPKNEPATMDAVIYEFQVKLHGVVASSEPEKMDAEKFSL